MAASPCATGVFRLWITHTVTRWTGPCSTGKMNAVSQQVSASAGLLSKKRGRVSFEDCQWELHVEGALVDDGCQGRARQLGAGSSLQFSEVVRKLEITLDRKMGRGAALTWSPPTQNTLAVDGLILQRSYQRGSRPCQMRFAVSLKDSPKRFKLSPVLAKIVNLRQESESKDRVVAALGRYVEQLQLRDVKDGRVVNCDAALLACFNVKNFTFSQLDTMLLPHLISPDPILIDYTVSMCNETSHMYHKIVDLPISIDLGNNLRRYSSLDTSPSLNMEFALATAAAGKPCSP